MDNSTCPCGNTIEMRQGRGRPRKYCAVCTPPRERESRPYVPRPKRTGTCKQCGDAYEGNGNRVYCGPLCAGRAAYEKAPRIPCRVCGEPTGWKSTDTRAPEAPKHADCLPEHGPARYKRGCRCDICRDAARHENAAYWAERISLNPAHLRCTTPGCDRPRKGRTLCTMHLKRAMREDGTWKPSPADAWNNPKRLARLQTRRAITRGATGPTDNFTVADLLARDNNECGICGNPIPHVAYPNPLSPSIDHIQPLSRGGSHTLTNARPAHLRCNIARGNRD